MESTDFINEICIKFNYDEKLKQALQIVLPHVISYYGIGYVEIIKQSLLNCPILKCQPTETIYDLMVTQDASIFEGGMVTEKDYKRASGVNGMVYDINYNGQYNCSNVKYYVGLANFSGQVSLGVLVHEISHLFKSYNNPIQIDGSVLTEKSGLIETKFELKEKDGTAYKTFLSEKNVGLEEGINSFDEEQIMRRIDPTYKSSGYTAVKLLAHKLFDSFELRQQIRNLQFNKDNLDMLKDESFQMISLLFDEVVELEYKKFANIFNPDMLNMYNQQILEKMLNVDDKINSFLAQSHCK